MQYTIDDLLIILDAHDRFLLEHYPSDMQDEIKQRIMLHAEQQRRQAELNRKRTKTRSANNVKREAARRQELMDAHAEIARLKREPVEYKKENAKLKEEIKRLEWELKTLEIFYGKREVVVGDDE